MPNLHSASGAESSLTGARWFASTHWSVVLTAGQSTAPGVQEALETLCRSYWSPIYTFLRRRGYSPVDAEDLTQGFFSSLLARKHFRVADPDRGRFRSFLLGTLKHFLSDENKKARAQKRGGGQSLIPLDAGWAEEKFAGELSLGLSDEKVFDRRWALAILDRAVERLRQEYAQGGKLELFEELKQFQPGEQSHGSYAETRAQLGLTESAIKSAIFRMRTRHRELLREEVAHTVSHAGEVDQEIRYLISVIAG